MSTSNKTTITIERIAPVIEGGSIRWEPKFDDVTRVSRLIDCSRHLVHRAALDETERRLDDLEVPPSGGLTLAVEIEDRQFAIGETVMRTFCGMTLTTELGSGWGFISVEANSVAAMLDADKPTLVRAAKAECTRLVERAGVPRKGSFTTFVHVDANESVTVGDSKELRCG